MTLNTIRTKAARLSIHQAVIMATHATRGNSTVARAMLVRCGMVALGRIKTAFIAKARGGTDEAGDSWAPLKPSTIAYSVNRGRGRGGRTKAEKKRDAFPSQALNAKQQDKWWEVYRRQLAIYKGDKGHAAAVAWVVLKASGAKTLLEKYGTRKVEILRDTGLLLNSLSPGVASPHAVFRIESGAVIVGTNRKGAAYHHLGVPGRLPMRRLWPSPQRWPATWWADILSAMKQGLIDIAKQLVRGT